MAQSNPNVVSVAPEATKLPDGVVVLESLPVPEPTNGCRVFTHYNGPTDQLSGLCAGHVCGRSGRDAASPAYPS